MSFPIYLFVCLALTVLTEDACAGLFYRIERYDRTTVALINCITNPVVSLLVYLFPTVFANVFVLLLLEIFVVLSETLAFSRLIELKREMVVYFSLVLNAASFLAGILLQTILTPPY